MYRILDANINRASEGIRVAEDILRFMENNINAVTELRTIRHFIRKSFKDYACDLLLQRSIANDIGIEISRSSKLDSKLSQDDLLSANFKRAAEAIRVLEEVSKVSISYELSKKMELNRFKIYEIERRVMLKLQRNEIPCGLYGITYSAVAGGRNNVECVKCLIDAGVRIIQYREKFLPFEMKLKEAAEISKLCKTNHVKFIVNDHVDIALMVDADGVHLGQDDFSIEFARKLLGKSKIIGRSTHSPEQAVKAIEEGADYIGVGPIFRTATKDRNPVGLAYLDYAIKNVNIPFIAIGGIKRDNLESVLKPGVKRAALVSETIGAEDITETANLINRQILADRKGK